MKLQIPASLAFLVWMGVCLGLAFLLASCANVAQTPPHPICYRLSEPAPAAQLLMNVRPYSEVAIIGSTLSADQRGIEWKGRSENPLENVWRANSWLFGLQTGCTL